MNTALDKLVALIPSASVNWKDENGGAYVGRCPTLFPETVNSQRAIEARSMLEDRIKSELIEMQANGTLERFCKQHQLELPEGDPPAPVDPKPVAPAPEPTTKRPRKRKAKPESGE